MILKAAKKCIKNQTIRIQRTSLKDRHNYCNVVSFGFPLISSLLYIALTLQFLNIHQGEKNMAAQLVPSLPTSIVLQPSDQTPWLAMSEALAGHRVAQQELLQLVEKLQTTFDRLFDRLVKENVGLQEQVELLKGVIETQNKINCEKFKALSGQIDAVQKLTLEQAKTSEEKMGRMVEQLRSDVKAAHNEHSHNYAVPIRGINPTATSTPNKQL